MLELGLGECARELKRKEVINIKYKICGLTETHFIGNSNLKSDILESVSYLIEQGILLKIIAFPNDLLKVLCLCI